MKNILKMILIAVLYILVALLAYRITFRPADMLVVWPLSGLALAAVLIWGWPATLGVFAGALFILVQMQASQGLLLLSILTATIIALQSMTVAWLLKRYVGLPPRTAPQTLLATAICIITAIPAPLLRTSLMLYFGLMPWNNFASQILMGWTYVMIGVLIFTPGLTYMALRRSNPEKKEPMIWLPTSLFIGLTLLAVVILSQTEQQRTTETLQRETAEMAKLIQNSMEYEIQDLVAISALLRSSGQQVPRAEFQDFASSLLSNSATTSTFEWLPHVTLSERPAYEQSLRKQGYTNFFIFEKDSNGNNIPARQRAEYYPVDYIQPFQPNKSAFGYDLGSQPELLNAIQRARASGLPATTSPIQIIQAINPRTGVLIIVPVYKKDAAITTFNERNTNLEGLIAGVYQMHTLLDAILARINHPDLEFYIYDVQDALHPKFLAFHPSLSGSQISTEGDSPTLSTVETGIFETENLQIADRAWLLVTHPGPADLSFEDEWLNLLIILIGLGLAGGFLIYIRARQKAETALALSESEFRNLSDYALIGVLRLNLSGEILYANQALAQMVGFATPGELLHIDAHIFTSPEVQFIPLLELLRNSNQLRNQEIDIRSQQGEIRHVLYSASLQNNIVSATLVDITEREEAKEKISNSEKRYRQLVEGMPGVVYSYSDKHGGLYYSPAVENIFGFTTKYMLENPMTWHNTILNEDLTAVDQAIERFVNGENLDIEYRIYNRQGEIRWLADRSIGREVLDGETIMHGLVLDITHRRQAEETLRQRDAEYRLISEHTGDMIFMINLEDQAFTYVSPLVTKLLGYTPQEMLSFDLQKVLTTESYQKFVADIPERMDAFFKRAAPTFFTDVVDQFRKDGTILTSEVVTTLVAKEDGKIQLVGVSRDISERKQATLLQETVYRIAEDAQNSESLLELYPQIHKRISDIMSAENFYIALYDKANDMLSFVYSEDEHGRYDPTPSPAGQGLTEHVIRTQQPLLCDDRKAEELFNQGTYTPRGNFSPTWLGVPLIVHGTAIGMMAVQNYHDPLAYTEREQHILEFVSSQVATVIDRKQTEEHLRQSQTSLELAQTVGQMGSWDLDLELGRGSWSNEMYQLMGRNPAAGVPDFSEFLEMIHPDDRSSLLDAQKLAIKLGQPITTIFHSNQLSKPLRYFESRILPIRGVQDKVRKLSGTLLDITKRHLAEMKVGERVKELTCLFTISRLLEDYSSPEPFIYQQIVDSLLPAMQFPLLAAALIELDEERYFTERYSENLTCCMTTEIIVAGKKRGQLSAFYSSAKAVIIPEEQDLIDNLARMLAQWLIRVQAEKSLRESNERFSQLADNIQEAFWIYDTVDNELIYLSPASEIIWGSPLQTLYDHPTYYRDSALPEYQQNLIMADEKQNRGEASDIEYRIRRPDGSLRWVWDRAFPIFDKNGKIVRTAGVTTDITDLKVAQQALHDLNRNLENRVEERTAEVHQNEVTYRALFENSNDGIFILSPEGFELRANQQALLMLGYSQDEWQGSTYSKLVVPEEKQDSDQRFKSVLRGEHVPLYERTIIRKDGKKVEVEINLSAVRDDNGRIMLVQSVVRDITERKRAEEALRASSELFDKFMMHSPIYAFVKDVTPERSLVLYSSENYVDMIGVTGSQMVGKTMHAFFSPEFADKVTADDWDVVSKGEMITLEEELNGRSYTSLKFPILQGERTLLAGYTIDITEHKKAEETLRESEDRYRRAISSADAVPYSLDYASNAYTFMGEGIERLTGYSREEMTPDLFNSSAVEAKFSGDLAGKSTMEVVQLVRSGAANPNGVLRCDFRIVTKAGEYRWLADSSVQVLDKLGHFSGSIGILLDITDRKEAEETLRESRDILSAANISLEKASRMKDEFLASMSHELRTPLTGILGLAEALQLQTQGPLNDRQLKAMGNIEKSGRHLLELINDILDLSKIEAGKMDLELESFSVADVCQASLQLVKGMAHQKKINTSFSMNMSPLVLKADSRRLKQMLVNLLSNAIKFTPASGQIGLEVEARPEQNVVCFHVWDKGIGIRSDEMGKLFQPFVQLDSSLARQYAGTGLGLSLVQRMAELHGGSVQVESNPGEGSRFSILLPWREDEPEPNQPEAETFQIRNTLTIEDNDLDAEQITRYLKEIGIANFLQPVAQGALEKAASLRPNAILLDLNLPDGTGLDLLTKLKTNEQTRDIPVIITSVEDRQADARRLGASDYLVKPYKREDLRIALAKVAALQANQTIMVIGTNKVSPLVLVADDNELILETLSEFLTSSGFRVIAVHSGYELLEQASEHQPDICLIDIQMPGMDGMETMRRMRAHGNPKIASTPMIAITALAMSGDRERCIQAGANEYMSKPLIMKQLVKMIIQILSRKAPPSR